MSEKDEMEKYVKDSRIPCKYGNKCYQKNSAHHEKYKHPIIKRKNSPVEDPVPKKQKLRNNTKTETEKTGTVSNTDENQEKQVQQSSNDDSKMLEDEEPLPENLDQRIFIKEKFLVDMPEDFYLFWEFCKEQNPKCPSEALKDFGLILVGPYDVLADKFCNAKDKTPEMYLLHWRYYYDPPEFQTVIKSNSISGYHIGYFRDSPNEPPVFLASNNAERDGVFEIMGENIFAAVNQYLESKQNLNPFAKMKASKFQSLLSNKAKELNLSLLKKTPKILQREKKILARTFNKLGLVVPYNKKTQLGYRPLAVSNKELQTLLMKLKDASADTQPKLLADLQHIITATSIALDECDFGTGLEFGWDLFFFGIDSIKGTTMRFLMDSYRLLERDTFAKIAEAHLKNRSKGSNLSIL